MLNKTKLSNLVNDIESEYSIEQFSGEAAYINLIKLILRYGTTEETRTGLQAITYPGYMIYFDLSDGFPLFTHKKIAINAFKRELEGFIKGKTDKRFYKEYNCKLWNEWSSTKQMPSYYNDDERKEYQYNNNDLGPLGYSHGWRNFGGKYKPIPYINTGFDKKITVTSSTNELVGKKGFSSVGSYTVIEYDETTNEYTIKFDITGYVAKKQTKEQILDNHVFDYYYPIIYDVAALGDYGKYEWYYTKEERIKLYSLWDDLVKSFYFYKDEENKYKYLSNDWLIYANFLRDLFLLSGWNSKRRLWSLYRLTTIDNSDCYSKDTCIWVFDKLRPDNNLYEISYYDVTNKITVYENITDISLFFDKNKDININECVIVNTGHLNKEKEIGVDQLSNIVNKLRKKEYDRRMLCSAWEPNVLSDVALPACHVLWNVFVTNNDTLNLSWFQRSCDVPLGLPGNILSYSLLLHLLCKEGKLKEGRVTGFIHNCHIYENQLDGIEELLKRKTHKFPKIDTENFTSIFDWKGEDTKFINYIHEDTIYFPIAI